MMNKFSKFIFVLVLLLASGFLFAKSASAATFYVDATNGLDSNDGQAAVTADGHGPWKTVEHAFENGGVVVWGDTIKFAAGVYDRFAVGGGEIRTNGFGTGTDAPVIIEPLNPGDQVTFKWQALDSSGNPVTSTKMFYFLHAATGNKVLTFNHIKFLGSDTGGGIFLATVAQGNQTLFEDCEVDWQNDNPANSLLGLTNTSGGQTSIVVRRSYIHDTRSYFIENKSSDDLIPILTVESSIIKHVSGLISTSYDATIRVVNNTFTQLSNGAIYAGNSEDFHLIFANNLGILQQWAGITGAPLFLQFTSTAAGLLNTTQSNYVIKNNIVWNDYESIGSVEFENIFAAGTNLVPLDISNIYMNPEVTNYAGGDYTPTGAYFSGHGAIEYLPSGGDYNGNTWTGSDVGAIKNPSATLTMPTIDAAKFAFAGDSIANGSSAGATENQSWYLIQVAIGKTVVDDDSWSGIDIEGLRFAIDKTMVEQKPKYVFLEVVNGLGDTPESTTYLQYANEIILTLQKIQYWGAIPIWLGIPSQMGPTTVNADAINDLVETWCATNGVTYGSMLDQMRLNSSWSTDYYANIAADVHPNAAGHLVIAKTAEYLYYPKFNTGTDLVDPTGSIRIYSDGKYRYTTATSSTQTANFSVSPVGGWPSSDYSEYMNVTLESWQTSGAKNKQWTATSSIATNTVYTIGNLAPSKYYQFKLDGAASTTAISGDTCTNGLCLSDSSGNLTFTYTGGYSTHTFALEQNTGAPTNVGISSISADSTTQLTITSQTATDADPGLHSVPYWFNETTGHSGGSSSSDWQSSTSFVDSGLSANTQYTYQVKARDNNLNESAYSDSLSKYTLAPIPTNLSASSNSNSVTLSVDSLSNDTSGQSGYYFSRSGANSGWIQTNSWTDTGLSCGNSYTYSVKHRNGDGTETSEISTTKSTSGCGGGGSPAMWTLPIVPTNGFKMSINGGAATTSSRAVFLGFNAGSDIKKMAISMTGDFTDASQENYVASKQWDLCSKLGGAIKNPTCPDGTYKVYAQFYTAYGRTTGNAFASSTIVLKSSTIPTENLQQTNNLLFTNSFTKYLQYRQTNADIKRLQIFLNADPDTKIADTGAGSPGKETNYFGLLTYKAVIKFQEKYAKDILVPWGFVKGTGYVGKTTLTKINELMGNK